MKMYHTRWKGTHYEAGWRWGNRLFRHGFILSDQHTFTVTEERKAFASACLPLYQAYYPEILDEIRGIADGQRASYEELCAFLFSMYCFEFTNHCTCFALQDKETILLCRNSDFLASLEKLYMNCMYALHDVYAFCGNTTAFVQMEDGVNEHGLAIGLTFVYPSRREAGFHAGMLVRYLLEKCKDTKEALQKLAGLPIASQQTLTIADPAGELAVVECNAKKIKILRPDKEDAFVIAVNNFHSMEMKEYRNPPIDDWRSEERYETVYRALKDQHGKYSLELAKGILSGKYGFMCQYDRRKDADTVWSVIYDLKKKTIFRVEGNPGRKAFKEDNRFTF